MMNDKITPFGFDLTKDLRGHVRVETRDRWTGRVWDSQEKDNLITNALREMITTTAWTNTAMASVWTPIYQKVLGGIFAFSGTLTASADNTTFPSSVKLVGYAGQNSENTDPYGGSYNGEESTKLANGFMTVWDFTSSQANGTIGSVARTSSWFAGFPPFNNTLDCSISYGAASGALSTKYAVLGYDATNKYLYIAPTSGETIDGVTYSGADIYRVKQDFSRICLVNALPAATEMTLIKTLTAADGTATARYWTYDAYADNFVYANGTTLHVVAMDGTHSTKSLANTSASTNNTFAVTENYYWRSTGSVVYQISKTDTSNVQSYSIANSEYLAPSDNDIVFSWTSSATSTTCYIIYPDGTIIPKTYTATASGKNYNHGQVGPFYTKRRMAGAQGTNPIDYTMFANAHYLGTIANLDSPVTKSSSQLMKISYTLTEA